MAARDSAPELNTDPTAQLAEALLPAGERVDIAIEAAWELEALADMMLRELKDASPEDLHFRTIAVRVRQLASMQMSALGDTMAQTAALWPQLTGLRRSENVGA